MKILLFSYNFYPDVGGIESISRMLAEYFLKSGNEVRVITKTKNRIPINFPFKVIRDPNVITVVKQLKWADIVFENNPCFSMSYPNLFMRKPSVISLQTWLESIHGKVGFRHKLKYNALKFSAKVIACSEVIKNTFPNALVIPNPYNEELFKRDPLIKKTKDFIFLGRLVSDKGAGIAIKALHILITSNSFVSLTIVGNGDEMPVLKELVRHLRLQDYVNFKGTLQGKELVNCLNEHRYMVVPSVWKEPFGIVVLEGLACGCIPIVADGGGLQEAAGTAGLTFKRGNADDLARCMKDLIQKQAIINGSNSLVKQHLQSHTISSIGNQYLHVFDSVLKN